MTDKNSEISVELNAARKIQAEQLRALYDSEPWWPERSLDDIEFILQAHTSVGAWDGDSLIGFARAVSDSKFRAYIEDVLVLEEYRRKGTGAALLRSLLAELGHIHVVTLFCQPKLSAYYADLGFKEFSKQVVMHLRNVR